jgi:hypothetical protein
VFSKILGISLMAEELLTSQEGLSSRESAIVRIGELPSLIAFSDMKI